jgi:3-vinyl bacteriochlorophyllide hydratase
MPTYTPAQLARRDASVWTRVQVILAPIQFLAFLMSFGLVVRYLLTGSGYAEANISVLVKIALLWAITITGMVWENEIFGQHFLAPQFFWEDVGNAVAMLFHNLYFVALWLGWSDQSVMTLMLVAYCTYLVNCAQFVVKGIQAGRQRRLQGIGNREQGSNEIIEASSL